MISNITFYFKWARQWGGASANLSLVWALEDPNSFKYRYHQVLKVVGFIFKHTCHSLSQPPSLHNVPKVYPRQGFGSLNMIKSNEVVINPMKADYLIRVKYG